MGCRAKSKQPGFSSSGPGFDSWCSQKILSMTVDAAEIHQGIKETASPRE